MCVSVCSCISVLFCPAELSSVGLIIAVISPGTSRDAGRRAPHKRGVMDEEVLMLRVPASRLSPALEQPPRHKGANERRAGVRLPCRLSVVNIVCREKQNKRQLISGRTPFVSAEK